MNQLGHDRRKSAPRRRLSGHPGSHGDSAGRRYQTAMGSPQAGRRETLRRGHAIWRGRMTERGRGTLRDMRNLNIGSLAEIASGWENTDITPHIFLAKVPGA